MDGASAAYLQSDQFWAVVPAFLIFNQISVLVLFQAVFLHTLSGNRWWVPLDIPCGCWCQSTRLGRRLVWWCGGWGRCVVGGCVNLLSDNLHQRGVAWCYFLSPPVLHHVWYCSAWGAVRQGTDLGHEEASVASCSACTHLIGHLSSSTLPGWYYVVVCLVQHSRRNSALQVVAWALQRTMCWLLCLQ